MVKGNINMPLGRVCLDSFNQFKHSPEYLKDRLLLLKIVRITKNTPFNSQG